VTKLLGGYHCPFGQEAGVTKLVVGGYHCPFVEDAG
jgi:hypothetical protein